MWFQKLEKTADSLLTQASQKILSRDSQKMPIPKPEDQNREWTEFLHVTLTFTDP
jgi:hypothetical protein